MNTFTSKPVTRTIVPVNTVRVLIDGLLQYLESIIDFDYERLKIEKDAEEKQTSITLYGKNVVVSSHGFDIAQVVYISIYDKAVDSIDSKLWRDPAEIRISIPEEKRWMAAKITPLADRAISIEIVKAWNGTPGF